jgi:hypothetical protein
MTLLVKRGASPARLAALAGLAAASCLTQPRGLAIVIPVALAVALAFWRQRRPARRWVRAAALGVMAAVAAAGVAALVGYAVAWDVSGERVRQLASYVWQFYLPGLGFMQPSISPDYGIGVVFDRFFGSFGMLEASFTPGVLRALKVAALVVGGLALVGAAVLRRDGRRCGGVVLVFAAAVVGYLALLHAVAFRTLLTSPDPVITGRYLLPLLSLYGLAVALAVSWMPARWGRVAGGALMSGVLLLQFAAIGVLFARFYA